MKIHEYQGKELFRRFGMPTPRGFACFSVDEAVDAARKLGGGAWVVKAQIHAGGRGKGGGVKLARSLDEVREKAGEILGMRLKTHQTGPEGQIVRRLLVEEGAAIARELYVGMVVDRGTQRVALMASSEGGMDIEAVAANTPEKIHTFQIEPIAGYSPYIGNEIAVALGVKGDAAKQLSKVVKSLYDAFVAKDMSLLEINPLVITKDGNVICLDAKLNFDENALYRQKDIQALRDLDEEDPAEVEASKYDLSYIKLDGEIGCMVNGAGLAMATMDIIKLFGSEPANFLDVGGGATKEKVTQAFKIIVSDPNVKGILVNIFGGIMKCDIIADGIVAAAKEISLKVPLVVRLEGTNVEKGKEILAKSGLAITSADDLADAARKVVAAVKGSK